jgi:hypothetical protein
MTPHVRSAPSPEGSSRELRAHELIQALDTVDRWRAKIREYRTTSTSCDCLDYTIRHLGRHETTECKHQAALRLVAERKEATQ